MSETIEDLILGQDRRGVSELRHLLPADYCDQAARFILEHPGNVAIVTGFYILSAGQPETDGPPGAIAIGRALQSLGHQVSYISDRYTTPMLREWLGEPAEIIDFPIADLETSQRAAREIVGQIQPQLLISIERCGATSTGTYLNMRAADITQYTAKLDCLFDLGIPSVGIGDGGNEIGMGNLAEHIPAVDRLPDDPAVTTVDRLVLAGVSNWGGYGLVAALSRQVGQDLLPDAADETRLIRYMVDQGAVNGSDGGNTYHVDGFTLEENASLLQALRDLVP